MNAFTLRTGLHIAFDLNACWGRRNATAPMDLSMIFGLFNETARMAGRGASAMFAFQCGNEVYYSVDGTRYGDDMVSMAAALKAAWSAEAPGVPVPTLIGPDNAAGGAAHLDAILNVTKGAVTAATYHDYRDDCCAAPDGLALNTSCIDARVAAAVTVLGPVAARHDVPVWLSEGALHAISGVAGLTDTWTSMLWYAHALGVLARSGAGLFSRQTLLGGNCEIVDKVTGLPNPDYWMALVWHDFVGPDVFDVSVEGCDALCASALRVHAHSSPGDDGGDGGDATVLVVVNFALNASFDVDLSEHTAHTSAPRVLQLTGQPGHRAVMLNNRLLEVDRKTGAPPMLQPDDAAGPSVRLPPASVTVLLL